MGAGWLFISIVLAGYLFLRTFRPTRLGTLRAASYHILLESVVVGSILVAITRMIFWLRDRADISSPGKFFLSFVAENDSNFFMLVTAIVGGFVLAALFNRIANYLSSRNRLSPPVPLKNLYSFYELPRPYRIRYRLFRTREEMLEIDALNRGDFVTLMLARSCYERKIIEIVLTNGERYIGFAVSPNSKEDFRSDVPDDISIIPLVKYNLSSEKLNPVNFVPKIKQCLEEETSRDMSILITRSSIASVSFFEMESATMAGNEKPA